MKKLFFSIMLVAGFLASCSQNADKDYQTTESGLRYKFYEQSGEQPADTGRILKLEMVYKLNNDTVIFNSQEMGFPVYLELMEPQYPGDIYEGFALLAPGDSASFIINAEDFFLNTAQMGQLPPFATAEDEIYFDVKLLAALTEEEYQQEQEQAAEKIMQENQEKARQEDALLKEYIEEQNIEGETRKSGLIYVEKEKGSGQEVTPGSTVSVHYEGRLLDGTVFDSSLERGEPIEFRVGVGQVIPGWDEGITGMNVGGKATLIIPSYLGYGERGAGNTIPPFSTLVFDVEVIDVK